MTGGRHCASCVRAGRPTTDFGRQNAVYPQNTQMAFIPVWIFLDHQDRTVFFCESASGNVKNNAVSQFFENSDFEAEILGFVSMKTYVLNVFQSNTVCVGHSHRWLVVLFVILKRNCSLKKVAHFDCEILRILKPSAQQR